MDAWVWRDALRGGGAADVCDLDQLRSVPSAIVAVARGSFFNIDGILDLVKPRAAMSAEGLGSLPR